MNLHVPGENPGPKPPSKKTYDLPGIFAIIVVAGVLTVCCLNGVGMGIWAMVGDHFAILERIGLGLSGLFLMAAAVVAFVVRGLAGLRLTLACFYFLPIPILSVFAAGGIALGVCCAAVLLIALVAMHRPTLIRFYRTRPPVFRDHLLALCPVVFLLCPSML